MFNISDLIVILMIALAAFLGYRKGFVKTSFRIASFIIAIILSMILYKPVAGYIKENTGVLDWIVSTITKEERIKNNEKMSNKDEEKVENEDEITNENEEVKEIENEDNKNLEDILATFPENIKDYIEADQTINNAKEQVAIKIADVIINIMSMISIYIVAKLILMIVCFVLDGIMKIPLLKQINEIAGLGLGIILGIIQVYTALAVITFLSSVMEMPELIAYIKSSLITSILFEHNLLITLIF